MTIPGFFFLRKMNLSDSLRKKAKKLAQKPLNASAGTCGEWCDILNEMIPLVEGIEAFSGSPDLAKENESLKSELQSRESAFDTHKSDAESQIQVLRKELDALLKDKSEREKAEKYSKLPREQFWILEVLPAESQGSLKVSDVADAADWPQNETEVHLHHLEAMNPSLTGHTNGSAMNRGWFCTLAGTKHLMAIRASGEHVEFRRSDKLEFDEDRILRTLIGYENGISASLIDLRIRGATSHVTQKRIEEKLGMIAFLDMAESVGNKWRLTEGGTRYLSEHRGSREIDPRDKPF